MIFCVRQDLKMGAGKMCSQCGHAAIGLYKQAIIKYQKELKEWEKNGCAKIALKVHSENELLRIEKEARDIGLNTFIFTDIGRTQVEPNTITVMGIGPASSQELKPIIGYLKLLN